jgi:hypothetical protein
MGPSAEIAQCRQPIVVCVPDLLTADNPDRGW